MGCTGLVTLGVLVGETVVTLAVAGVAGVAGVGGVGGVGVVRGAAVVFGGAWVSGEVVTGAVPLVTAAVVTGGVTVELIASVLLCTGGVVSWQYALENAQSNAAAMSSFMTLVAGKTRTARKEHGFRLETFLENFV